MRIGGLFAAILISLSIFTTAHGKPTIRSIDFRNHTYPFTAPTPPFADLPKRIRVRRGLYHSPHVEPSLSYAYFKVAQVIYGDLTGGGQDGAAVVTIYGGASGDYCLTSIYLYTLRSNRPKLLAILNEDRVAKEYQRFAHTNQLFEAIAGGTKIRKGVLITEHLAGGAHCCPAMVFTLKCRMRGGRLIVVNRSLRRRTERDESIPHSADDR